MQDLTITLVQTPIQWHDPVANRSQIARKLARIEQPTDLIILPEMFTTGFTLDTQKQNEPEEGPTYEWMRQMAATYNSVIAGSIIVKSNEENFNRFLWVKPTGEVLYYDKRHLFRMADEHHYFKEGNDISTFEVNGWKVRPSICYDLRFPVWSRNTVTNNEFDYDILLFVANWPAARISTWDTLLKARAIENLSYCIGVNRVGTDGKGIRYNGHSACYNYIGEPLIFLEENESVSYVKVLKNNLVEYRNKFPANKDADKFTIDS